jgi:hypothetical protein
VGGEPPRVHNFIEPGGTFAANAVRLQLLVKALALGFDGARLKSFAKDCAKLRNDLAHYGGSRSRTTGYSDFISSVIKKNNALGPLCHALALTEIGLDPAAVRAWAAESPPAFRRNWYFAEVGLIDHADPNARSQGATAAR